MPSQQQMRIFLLIVSFLVLLIPFTRIALASDLPPNPRDDTPAQALERWNNHLKKQESYNLRSQRAASEMIASAGKGNDGRLNVQQTLIRSGVLEDGSKINIEAKVTKPVDTVKVAKTLTERLKNAKDYSKNLGKASIPSFVGMAAFHGLMEGIGWVMDEGGQVKKPNTDTPWNDPSVSTFYETNGWTYSRSSSGSGSCALVTAEFKKSTPTHPGYTYEQITSTSGRCKHNTSTNNAAHLSVRIVPNPLYNANSPPPENLVVSDSELETVVKNALESNNAALATAISVAIKSAYQQDNSEGQPNTINPLVKDAQDDMSEALPRAFENPTPSSPASRPSGSATITDGDKTIVVDVKPAPISGDSDSVTTPVIDPVTGQPTGESSTSGSFQFPAFCDWASIVCSWIDWTQEEPELKDEPLEIEDQTVIDYQFQQHVSFTGTCPFTPSTQNFDMGILGVMSFETDVTFICTFASDARPYIISLGHLGALLYLIFALRSGNA